MLSNFEKLILQPEKPDSILDVFMADENLSERSNLGRLFMMVEINSRERGVKEKVKEVYEMVKNDYYASPVPNIETSLETTCQNLNLNFKDIFNKPESWYKKVTILIGVTKEDQLVFSHLGSLSGYLIRQNKISQILNTQQEDDDLNFSQLTSGEIKVDDIIILSNYTLFDFFSLEKIKNILSKLSPQQSVEQFKNLITENSETFNVLSLIIKYEKDVLDVTEEDKEEKRDTSTKKYIQELYGSHESMERLESLKEKTNRTLGDSLIPSIKNVGKKLNFSKLAKKDNKKLKMPKEKRALSQIKNLSKIKLPTLSVRTRGIVIVLIIIFIASLFYLNYARGISQKNSANQDILDIINSNKEEAQAALIYQDTEKANLLLNDAMNKLDVIDQYNDKWVNKHEQTKKEIVKIINKINNVYEVETQNVTELIGSEIKKIVKDIDDGKIYVLDNSGKVFVLENNKLNVFLNSQNIVDLVFFADSQDWVYLTNENRFFALRDTNKNELNITLLEDAMVSDMKVYGERIYFLDNLHAIYKITSPFSANPQMTVWYSEDKDLINKAEEIFVDGNVWVDSMGKITKLFLGEKQNFNLTKLVVEELGSDLIIYTQDEWNNLYILDKTSSRLIVSDKNGVVKKQFLNSELSNTEKFIVNSEQNKIWFSIGNKFWEMELKEE